MMAISAGGWSNLIPFGNWPLSPPATVGLYPVPPGAAADEKRQLVRY
ncbi:hypothetical protein KCP69_04535 [Salmonella enterica subsp. enterica]|nr:hypothetical protein KCP69_04535 [Salmonella enterica subsp. enterica]